MGSASFQDCRLGGPTQILRPASRVRQWPSYGSHPPSDLTPHGASGFRVTAFKVDVKRRLDRRSVTAARGGEAKSILTEADHKITALIGKAILCDILPVQEGDMDYVVGEECTAVEVDSVETLNEDDSGEGFPQWVQLPVHLTVVNLQ
ncbi:hypothetical protein WMY93_005456 [Mugilogobius chulae]|uniref:Uncharacterized protein n=1 Tax=Mugilogobius chulae TaxID=88201 RepID=A0AAW0PJS8_9GOBI